MQSIYFLKAHHAGIQYRPVLTQYHRVPTNTALYWPSIQWFDGLDHINQIFSKRLSHWQPVPPCFDPVPPSNNQYRPLPSSSSTNKKCPLLAQCHQIQSSLWKNINLHIFSQLDNILILIRGRVWPGLPDIFQFWTVFCWQRRRALMGTQTRESTSLMVSRWWFIGEIITEDIKPISACKFYTFYGLGDKFAPNPPSCFSLANIQTS